MREQFRDGKGNGLAKPYVIFVRADKADLLVGLRVFGMANDWFMVAGEALLTGMRDILPWKKRYACDMPDILDRTIETCTGVNHAPALHSITLKFLAPVDAALKTGEIAPSLLARLLRRVDGVSRWQGMVLDPHYARDMARLVGSLDFSQSNLVAGQHISPSKRAKKRTHKTVQGCLVVRGPIAPILPILAIGERCHIGRGSVEGMGQYRLE